MHLSKYHNQHYFDIKTDYTMTFILPELSLCFVQRINITRNTNIKHMYMITVEKVTALKDPTCSAICTLVLKRSKRIKKTTFMNYCVNNTISLLVIILCSIIQRNVWLSGSTEIYYI